MGERTRDQGVTEEESSLRKSGHEAESALACSSMECVTATGIHRSQRMRIHSVIDMVYSHFELLSV